MYDICIFDLYGTLVDIRTREDEPVLWEKLALFYGYYGAFYTPEELQAAFRRTVSQMEAGQTRLRQDSHEAFPEVQIEKVFRKLYKEKGVEADETLAIHTGQFFRVLSTDYIRLYEGARELLIKLKARGKRCYLLSNAQAIFTGPEMRSLDLLPLFDGVLFSSDWEMRKPDEAFFRLLLDRYQIDPARAVMIGNDGITDIAGARAVGLATIYIHSNISPKEPLPQADYILEQMDLHRVGQIILGPDAE